MTSTQETFELGSLVLGTLVSMAPLDSTQYYIVAHKYSRRWMVIDRSSVPELQSLLDMDLSHTDLDAALTPDLSRIVQALRDHLRIRLESGNWMTYREVGVSFTRFEKPVSVYFELTTACNLSCKHCLLSCSPANTEFMDPSLVTRAIDDLKSRHDGVQDIQLRFSGGEPLLHPKLTDLVSYGTARGFGVAITTNGLLLTPSIIRFLDDQSAHIHLSLDGGSESAHDSIRGLGAFRRVAHIIDLIREEHPGLLGRLSIYAILHRGNINQLQDIVSFAISKGIRTIGFQPVCVTGTATNNPDIVPSESELDQAYRVLHEISVEHPDLTIIGNKRNNTVPLGTADSRDGCFMGRDIRVDVRGNVYGCTTILDTKYSVGNLQCTSLTSPAFADGFDEFNKAVRDARPHTIKQCQECIWVNFCNSGCISRTLNETGSVWNPAPDCAWRKKRYAESVRQLCKL